MYKFFFLFTTLLLLNSPLITKELIYESNNKNPIVETFTHIDNGILYNYKQKQKSYQVLLTTNENGASVIFTNIIEQQTNNAYLFNNRLIINLLDSKKIINLQHLELILFPEIQLQHFITNEQQTNMKYITINFTDYTIFLAKATKVTDFITNINELPHSKLEIFSTTTSSKPIKSIYYFDSQGIASIKKENFNKKGIPKNTFIKNK